MLRSSALFVSLLVVAACSKSAGNQDKGANTAPAKGAEKGMSPGDVPPPGMGGTRGGTVGGAGPATGGAAEGASDFKLKPEEGTLAIEVPQNAKAGTEVMAKVVVTPVGPYKINKEFPTKLELQSPEGVTIAKTKLTAGGHDQVQGDADAFDDKQLAFSVKLTPTAGNHTISGTFKFAVCDKDTCLAKKEQISIAVAAN